MAWQEDYISPAINEALGPIVELGLEPDMLRTEKKILSFFKAGATGLDFYSKSWGHVIEEYADRVFESLFTALGDRTWLCQADFLLVLDAAVKELFPTDMLEAAEPSMFEQVVLTAHDRSFEEHRFQASLVDIVQATLHDLTAQTLVCGAFESARKAAVAEIDHQSWNPLQEFVSRWLEYTVAELSAGTCGAVSDVISEAEAVEISHRLVESGAIPMSLVEGYGPPPAGWPHVDACVSAAFASGGATVAESGKWQGKASGGGNKVSGRGKTGGEYGSKGAGKAAAKAKADPPVRLPSAKRRKGGGKGKAAGNPHCTQQDDCLGTLDSSLFQHMDNGTPGDVYCELCWNKLTGGDPSIESQPYFV